MVEPNFSAKWDLPSLSLCQPSELTISKGSLVRLCVTVTGIVTPLFEWDRVPLEYFRQNVTGTRLSNFKNR